MGVLGASFDRHAEVGEWARGFGSSLQTGAVEQVRPNSVRSQGVPA